MAATAGHEELCFVEFLDVLARVAHYKGNIFLVEQHVVESARETVQIPEIATFDDKLEKVLQMCQAYYEENSKKKAKKKLKK